MSKGKLIVISAPSGCGKSTVVHALMDMRPNLKFSISATTRDMRDGEKDGVEYYFIDKNTFEGKFKIKNSLNIQFTMIITTEHQNPKLKDTLTKAVASF